MSLEVITYIGLGSNLGDPAHHVAEATDALAGLAQTRLVAASRCYRNPPMGPQDQPDYVNAVVQLATRLSPHRLLEELQAIEAAHGRVRDTASRWGPRTLDLDILLYGDLVLEDAGLTIPHPGLHQRPFVVVPLLELAPDVTVPGLGMLRAAAAGLDCAGLVPLES